jgi:hypothetical protein
MNTRYRRIKVPRRLLGWSPWLVSLVGLAPACGALHTGDRDSFAVHFTNDLSVPVVVALCHSANSAKCERPYYRDRIKPGEETVENISPDVRTEWAIESQDGLRLRCVVLSLPRRLGRDVRVDVSHAPLWTSPCRHETTVAALT